MLLSGKIKRVGVTPLFSVLPLLLVFQPTSAMGEVAGASRVQADTLEAAGDQGQPIRMAQVMIERRVIIKVPMIRPPFPDRAAERMSRPDTDIDDGPGEVEWVERKGPKCIAIRALWGATVTSARGIDLVMRNRERMRALLGRECRSADLYSGFYIQPDEDGALCAGRDSVLARGGADCSIREIRRLVPER